MTTGAADAIRLGGITLEQFAGVVIALEDEIPLAEVLAQEVIGEAAWAGAAKAWRGAIAGAPDLQILYVEARRVAEDCLARAVQPLDADPAAWSGLLAALTMEGNAAARLKGLGLRMSDVARIGRAWSRRAKESPEVARALADAAGKAVVPTTVACTPTALRPFPWSPRRSPAADGAPRAAAAMRATRLTTRVDGELPAAFDADLYAALQVALELVPAGRAKALSLCGLSEAELSEIEARWERRLPRDAAESATFSASSIDHRSALRRLLRGAQPSFASA